MGPDYLLYALLDAVVDQYFVVLEKIGEGLEEMEEDLINDPTPDVLERIYSPQTRADFPKEIGLAFWTTTCRRRVTE